MCSAALCLTVCSAAPAGLIKWQDHLPRLFTQINWAFSVPVGSSTAQSPLGQQTACSDSVELFVAQADCGTAAVAPVFAGAGTHQQPLSLGLWVCAKRLQQPASSALLPAALSFCNVLYSLDWHQAMAVAWQLGVEAKPHRW